MKAIIKLHTSNTALNEALGAALDRLTKSVRFASGSWNIPSERVKLAYNYNSPENDRAILINTEKPDLSHCNYAWYKKQSDYKYSHQFFDLNQIGEFERLMDCFSKPNISVSLSDGRTATVDHGREVIRIGCANLSFQDIRDIHAKLPAE